MSQPTPRPSRAGLAASLTLLAAIAAAPASPAAAATLPPGQEPIPDVGVARTGERPAPTVGRLPRTGPGDGIGVAISGAEPPSMERPVGLTETADPEPGAASDAAAVPPPPTFVASSGQPEATQVGFEGLDQTANGSTLIEPTDSVIAAGPKHLVQVVNRVVRIMNRDGSGAENIPLSTLFRFGDPSFPLPAVDIWGHPQVLYDAGQKRWVISMLAVDCSASGSKGLVLVAISTRYQNTPADEPIYWNPFFLDYSDHTKSPPVGYLPDAPSLGNATNKLAISANEFVLANTASNCTATATFSGASVTVVDWVSLLPDILPPSFPIGYVIRETAYNWRLAVQNPPTSDSVFAIGEVNLGTSTSHAQYVRFSGTAATTIATSAQINLTTNDTATAFTDPPQPVDPGGAIGPNAIDRQPTDAIYQAGRLTTVANFPCQPPGDATTRACVRVLDLNVASDIPTRIQDVVFGAANASTFGGGIGRASDGSLFVTYGTSSSSTGISAAARHQRPGDPAGQFSAVTNIRAGVNVAYAGDRWGDYVGLATDPLDSTAAWVAAPYVTTAGRWATRIAQLQTPGAVYASVAPVRLLDTRTANGLSGAFSHGAVRTWQIRGRGGIPNDAIAVTGNVTVTGQTAAGYVAVGPTMTATPTTSTINFPTGDNRANNLTVPLSASGTLSAVFLSLPGRTTHVLMDVTGYFTRTSSGSTYKTITPTRLLDSRVGNGLSGAFASGVPRTVQITGRGGVPAGAAAITGNLTVTGQTQAGYVALTPAPTGNPTTSNLNFPAGDNRANGFAVALGGGGTVSAVYMAGGGATAHIILDVTGYFVADSSGLRFVPLPPGRRLDTRINLGLAGAMTHGAGRTLSIRSHLGVAGNAQAITGNLTVTGQTAAGYAAMTQTATNSPTTSTLNFPLGDNRANGVFAPLAPAGSVGLVYMASSGRTTHLILDVTGYFR